MWIRHLQESKLIPELPPSMSQEEVLKFYDSLITQYETMSQAHKMWYTHKRESGLNCRIVTGKQF